jgi:hypothetical protein
MGAMQLLAQMLATIDDPAGVGVGAEMTELEGGVASVVHLPSGDRYRVIVQWDGDREGGEDGAG